MVGALPRRPSADHSRAGTSTASILVGLRCRAGAPVHAHEVPIAAVVVPAPFSLSPFLGPSLAHPRSLSRVLSHACPLSLSRFSRSLSRVFSTLVLSLSLLSRTRVPHSRVFSLSLSLSSRTRVSPRACSLFLSLSHSRSLSFLFSLLSLPLASVLSSRSRSRFSRSLSRVFSLSLSLSLSRRSAGSAHLTCRAMSRAAYPVPPLRPFPRPSLRISSRPPRHVASTQCHRSAPSAGHRSAPRRVRRATSRRFPAPRGIHPP